MYKKSSTTYKNYRQYRIVLCSIKDEMTLIRFILKLNNNKEDYIRELTRNVKSRKKLPPNKETNKTIKLFEEEMNKANRVIDR